MRMPISPTLQLARRQQFPIEAPDFPDSTSRGNEIPGTVSTSSARQGVPVRPRLAACRSTNVYR